MGLRGRPPEPTALKIIRGNPGKRPLPKNEPKPAILSTTAIRAAKPADADEAMGKWWDYYADIYGPMGLVGESDLMVLKQLATATAEREDFERKLAEVGPLAKSAKTGVVYVSPVYNLVTTARERELKLLAEFGSGPASRTRVKQITVPEKSGNPFERFDRPRSA